VAVIDLPELFFNNRGITCNNQLLLIMPHAAVPSLRLFALFSPGTKDIVASLGKNRKAVNEIVKKLSRTAP
jgi:hypothetical protein